MTTLVLTHPVFLEHDTGSLHPERPARLEAVLSALDAPEFAELIRREAQEATIEQISRAHPRSHVERILGAVPAQGHARLDPDTVLSPRSGGAALRAAGAVIAAVDAVLAGEATNAFCAVRPPGHHAETAHAMGFCLFNNIAIGALHAREAHGLDRVAVVDFDVHHGNGTQSIFEPDARLFLASIHQMPLYPGTGSRNERGVGNIVNVPMTPGSSGDDFRHAFVEYVLPELEQVRTDLVMISAGFDAHDADPLANLHYAEEDFAWATRKLAGFAGRHCGGRLVSALEGGYDLHALAASAAAHVRELMAV